MYIFFAFFTTFFLLKEKVLVIWLIDSFNIFYLAPLQTFLVKICINFFVEGTKREKHFWKERENIPWFISHFHRFHAKEDERTLVCYFPFYNILCAWSMTSSMNLSSEFFIFFISMILNCFSSSYFSF